MARSRLRSFAWLAPVGVLAGGTVAVLGCSGKIANGSLGSTSEPVSIPDVSTPATPCDSGYAHPNVCCEASAGQPASCVAYPGAPFTQCASGATTYPDPRSCCPLDGNGACAAPPPPPVDAGAGGGSCSYSCPVGWYSPPASGGSGGTAVDSTCCVTAADGSTTCTGGGPLGGGGGAASSSSGSGTPCACACPACDPDSGTCPPCPPCNCPAQPAPAPSCDACPPGWQTPEGEPQLCCSTAPDGTISCFSQGVPPPPPTEQDAGPPSAACFGGGGGGPDGSSFTQCGCTETVGGTDYTVTCTDPGGTCVCSEGASNSGPTVPESSPNCSDVTALFTSCGFPAPTGVSTPGSGSSSSGTAGSGGSSSGG